jgi:type IX secretion system PorP/SprF family membrane protein
MDRKGIKILLINLLIITCSVQVSAQQLIHQSQYMYNHFELNPAAAGNSKYLPVSFSFRKFWAGIEGSPGLQTLSAHVEAIEHMGMGVKMFNYTAGPERKTGIEGAYAYQIRFRRPDTKLCFGLSLQLYQYFLDKSNLSVEDQTDEVFLGADKVFIPDGTFGVYYYGENYYAGISVPQLIQRNAKLGTDLALQQRIRHYYIHGGGIIDINRDFNLEPSALIKLIEIGIFQADINAMIVYQEMISLGISYRTSDAIVIMAGYRHEKFGIGYSYDLTLSDIKIQSNGSHEVFLSYYFNNFFKE